MKPEIFAQWEKHKRNLPKSIVKGWFGHHADGKMIPNDLACSCHSVICSSVAFSTKRLLLLTSAHRLPVETDVILVPGPPGYTALPAGLWPWSDDDRIQVFKYSENSLRTNSEIFRNQAINSVRTFPDNKIKTSPKLLLHEMWFQSLFCRFRGFLSFFWLTLLRLFFRIRVEYFNNNSVVFSLLDYCGILKVWSHLVRN